MRILYALIVALFVGITAVFAFENFTAVTVSMLGYALTAPIAAIVAIAYVLGMFTGGGLVSFLKPSLHEATRASRKSTQ